MIGFLYRRLERYAPAALLAVVLSLSNVLAIVTPAMLVGTSAHATMSLPFPGPGRAQLCPSANSNLSLPDLRTVGICMTTWADQVPTAGGTLTVNGQSMGSYDSRVVTGNQNVTTFTNSDWFTTTADSRSAFVVIKGDFTIGSGQTFIPSNRKLFTMIYVTGNCTITGGVSMTARGANHSASGSNITPVAVKIATGTFSGVTDPEVPAAGGAGASTTSSPDSPGQTGTAGSAGGLGGGGSGAGRSTFSGTNAGSAGTAFSGGTGGGSSVTANASVGATNGGAGGAANSSGGGQQAGGGAGNPGGAGSQGGAAGGTGTGGTLIMFCLGTLSGAGTIASAGVAGGTGNSAGASAGGGGSGGGSITVMYGSDSGPTPTAAGGAAGQGLGGGGINGGAGGAGTARKLAL